MPTMEMSGQKRLMTPVFLSWSRPVDDDADGRRWKFIRGVVDHLHDRHMLPVTCNVNVRDDDNPLRSMVSNISRCDGLLAIALGKLFVVDGRIGRENDDLKSYEIEHFTGKWVTSPYIHMEVAMAYLAGIPIRIIVERGVLTDGALDDRIIERHHKSEVDLDSERPIEDILNDSSLTSKLDQWADKVRQSRQRRHEVRRWYDP